MAYATIADVETYAPARAPFSANTLPSASGVAQLLEGVQADVEDVLVRAGYAVPVTGGTLALRILRDTVAKGAAAQVERIAPTSTRIKESMSMFLEAKKMLLTTELPGVARDRTQAGPRSGFDTGGTAMLRHDQVF